MFFTITLCGSIYERLVFASFLMLPLIKVGVTLENSHINSSLCFKLSSNCISCLIIFITDTILSWMIFFVKKKIIHFLNDFVSICSISSNRNVVGAGSENRTRATRSEAWYSTTKLYPHISSIKILYYKTI